MINHIINSTIHNIQSVLEHGGYWILVIVVIIEGLPLIGTIIPGQTIVVMAGFFAKLGVLDPWYVLIIVSLSAILGDLLGYEIGKKYGMKFVENFGPYVLIKPHHIERAKGLINAHTGKSIIIGRFTAITRSLIPFIAGATGIHKGKFWFFNLAGSVLWAVASVALGYAFGASYEIAAQYFGRFAMVGVILATLLLFAYHYINKNRHIFAKYQVIALLTAVASSTVFFWLVDAVFSRKSFLSRLDIWVSRLVDHSHTWYAIGISKWISNIFSPTTLAVASVLLLIWTFRRRLRHEAMVILLSYPIGVILGYVVKEVVGRDRPGLMVVKAGGHSFPSGHATAAALFFSLIIYLAFKHVKNPFWREISISASIIMAIIVALTRVYLNVHWLTDVVAGLALGALTVSLVVLILRYLYAMIGRRKAKSFAAPSTTDSPSQ